MSQLWVYYYKEIVWVGTAYTVLIIWIGGSIEQSPIFGKFQIQGSPLEMYEVYHFTTALPLLQQVLLKIPERVIKIANMGF